MEKKQIEGAENGSGWLKDLAALSDPSWISRLVRDPEEANFFPNKKSRPVRSGHFVGVHPTPLTNPVLVHFSTEMAEELGLRPEACRTTQFVKFFSGDFDSVSGFKEAWATPYALSIYGQRIYQNCPFGDGTGYGDGRAISVGEVFVNGKRWEMQLKGSGTTPFCRGADGRAVLRSSVREFLASEAMHHLGVSTTRALSLVTSTSDTIKRPWYSGKKKLIPNSDSMSQLPKAYQKTIFDRYRKPDVYENEIAAITCRVAPSFMRVGHIEVHSRRVAGSRAITKDTPEHDKAKLHLRQIVEHAIFREYPQCNANAKDQDSLDDTLQPRILTMMTMASQRIAQLTANWIRVGYCQGNFNSDNTLMGGRTMDYGPFGFIEKFEPLWNMWLGGGEHFGFLNQPTAGGKNFETLVNAMIPLLDKTGARSAQQIIQKHNILAEDLKNDTWRQKLGLKTWSNKAKPLLEELLTIMENHPTDYTMLWRELASVAEVTEPNDNTKLLAPLQKAFFKPLPKEKEKEWITWLRNWLDLVDDCSQEKTKTKIGGKTKKQKPPPPITPPPIIETTTSTTTTTSTAPPKSDNRAATAAAIRLCSPKYVPREWMLVDAYTAANKGDYSIVEELYQLFKAPYSEQPEFEKKYYKKTPMATYEGVGVGGVSHMT